MPTNSQRRSAKAGASISRSSGLGDNGHTASLFPGLAAIEETSRPVVAAYVEVVGMWRLTLTPPAINAARRVAFLVSGAGKADVLARVLEGPYDPTVLPSQIVRPRDSRALWLVDAAAASRLAADEMSDSGPVAQQRADRVLKPVPD